MSYNIKGFRWKYYHYPVIASWVDFSILLDI